jgi:hypothetical protein
VLMAISEQREWIIRSPQIAVPRVQCMKRSWSSNAQSYCAFSS